MPTNSNNPAPSDTEQLAQQAAELFLKAFGTHSGFRLAHAKGIVCEGVFTASPEAAQLSRAGYFSSGSSKRNSGHSLRGGRLSRANVSTCAV